MSPERWQRISDLLAAALHVDPGERNAFVAAACKSDMDLRAEVDSLLAQHEDDNLLERSGGSVTDGVTPTEIISAIESPGRFSVSRPLGIGAFGAVFEVYDHRWKSQVALKFLQRIDPMRLYRFKREFRTLAEVRHPNLIRLYELFSDDDCSFFTMELVRGVDVIRQVRGDHAVGLLENQRFGLLRATLLQLCESLRALHSAGYVHCDVKPANVLAADNGRVVLLDLGLAKEIGRHDSEPASQVAGTPAYMAPEQASGRPVREASDWYAVGMILYQALTGTVPFRGPLIEVLWRKQHESVDLESLEGPSDLIALCRALLDREPERRPAGSDILEIFSRGNSHVAGVGRRPDAPLFVGRESEISALRESFSDTYTGQAVVAHVHGRSGMGKTTLIRRFLEELQQNSRDTVVLAGRCYERETVPYKALDEFIDALFRYLQRMPLDDVERVLPRDVRLLTRLFPVLQYIPSVANARTRAADAMDIQELRHRAFGALRELVARIADRKPLVIWIDDLQWADADSVAFLRSLLAPPSPPPLLLIISYRSEDLAAGGLRDALHEAGSERMPYLIRDVTVDVLAPDEARSLAGQLLKSAAGLDVIVRESLGNPFFLHELARHGDEMLAVAGGAGFTGWTVHSTIQRRVSQLSPGAQRLLTAISIAGQPVNRGLACRVADVETDHGVLLALLVDEHLLRSCGSTQEGRFETYHDQVREAVVSTLSAADRRACHHAMAMALESEQSADYERLAEHFREAGNDQAAYKYVIRAAEYAAECLAFDRAATLYEAAITLLRTGDPDRELELRRKYADALANAGRGSDAAREYLNAGALSSREAKLKLQRLAADQLLRSGSIDAGISLMRTVLGEIRIWMPQSRRLAIAAVLASRLHIALRGLRSKEQPQSLVSEAAISRMDSIWSASTTMTAVDPVLGAYFRAQHLLLALRHGEPCRLAMALGMEAVNRAMPGAARLPKAHELLLRAKTLAERTGDPYTLGVTRMSAAGVAFFAGLPADTIRLGEEAEDILKSRTGVAWELTVTRMMWVGALGMLGQWQRFSQRVSAILVEAEAKGDVYAQAGFPLSACAYSIRLAEDDPESSLRQLEHQLSIWSRDRFDLPHYSFLFGKTESILYSGEHRQASDFLHSQWKLLRSSLILRFELQRMFIWHLRARCALAQLTQEHDSDALLAEVDRFLRQTQRSESRMAAAFACLVKAAVTLDRQHARLLLEDAEHRFESLEMAQYAAVSRRRRGELTSGAVGAALVNEANNALITLGARSPDRMTAMLAPGRWNG